MQGRTAHVACLCPAARVQGEFEAVQKVRPGHCGAGPGVEERGRDDVNRFSVCCVLSFTLSSIDHTRGVIQDDNTTRYDKSQTRCEPQPWRGLDIARHQARRPTGR
jgi:hypothetical protein